MNISVIGVGKVGLTLCCALAEAGYKVYGLDINEKQISKLNSNTFKSQEPNVNKILKKFRNKIIFSTNLTKSITETNTTIIIVPTNTNKYKSFSNKHILNYFDKVKDDFKKKKTYHTFSIMSTTIPLSCEYDIIPYIIRISKKKLNSFGLCYNPSFIAQGEIYKGITNPDYVLIGSSQKKTYKKIFKIHKKITKTNTSIVSMKLTEAEITKIASNTYETLRVSFANMLTEISQSISGVNVDNISNALTFRVGKRFFKGATPYGGPCWPRDNLALGAFMKQFKINFQIPMAAHNYNIAYSNFLIDKISSIIKKYNGKIGVIGLSYKIGSPLLVESFGIKLIKKLLKKHKNKLIGYDPLLAYEDFPLKKNKKIMTTKNLKFLNNTKLIIIALPYDNLPNYLLKNCIVIDLWRTLDEKKIKLLKKYYPIGNSYSKSLSKNMMEKIRKIIK